MPVPPLSPTLAAVAALVRLTGRRLHSGPAQPGMPFRVEAVREVTRPFAAHLGRRSPGAARRLFDRLQPGPPPSLARRVRSTAGSLGGRPAWWFRPVEPPSAAEAALLYLHGGGYRYGSAYGYRELIVRLALAGRVDAVGVDYRLAPEHPFPAAVHDACAAYLDLLARGVPADRIVVSGDSAGGGLALALLLCLRADGHPLPAGAHLISPWTDLTASGPARKAHGATDIIHADEDDADAREYLGGADPTDPLASPCFADLAGLPPLLVQVGGAEILLDDAVAVAGRARDAGVDVDLHVYPYLFHDFPTAAAALPEARAAIEEAGAFIRERIA